MNQHNNQNQTPGSGVEMRQLTFLAVILAALLVLVLGGFVVVQFVLPLFGGNNTPPIHDNPGSNLTEPVDKPDPEAPGEDQPTWLEGLFATIQGWFNGGTQQGGNSNYPGADPNATYPFASNASVGSVIPTGDGATIDGTTTYSEYSIVVNMSAGKVVASERADERMYPASMTKVMTLLVAVEHLQHQSSLQDKITVSEEIRQQMINEGSSGVGFDVGEELSVESMLYATLLQSDGIAATELAVYIAGSEQAFVELMNQKAQELGLTQTNFVNTHGLHDDNHYTTAREMAAIMRYAMQNELCAKIMSTERYNATGHYVKNGQPATYTFYFTHSYLADALGRYPAYAQQVPIVAAKTGLETKAKSCLVSYIVDKNGNAYVCVTAFADGQLAYMDDHAGLYNKYAK